MKKKLLKLKYPKLSIFVVMAIIAYLVFSYQPVQSYVSSLNGQKLGYLGSLIAGFFFSFGFTTPFSVGYFITMNTKDVFFHGILGGIGAVLADLLIFIFVRFSFKDEFQKLKKEKPIKAITHYINGKLNHRIRRYLMFTIAGIIISSPLPDEAGIIMLAGMTNMKKRNLALISFIFSTLGIVLMLLIWYFILKNYFNFLK